LREFNRVNFFRTTVITFFIALTVVGCGRHVDPALPDLSRSEGLTKGALDSISGKDYVPGEVLVVLTDDAEASTGGAFLGRFPLTPIREKAYHWGTLHRMSITDGTAVEDMCRRLMSDPRVKIAEPNYYVHFAEVPYTPNDPMWENDSDPGDDPRDSIWEQWGPAKLGASIVWNGTKGDENLIVAVLDTGVRFTHEDLNANIWINEDEDPSDGIDNDENGWTDDWWGWNCWENNNVPFDLDGSNWYHGTGCSGVIAGVQDNGLGVSGLAPHVRIMAIRADCGILALGSVESVVEGWDYAKTNGASIISMSFYVNAPTEVLETAAFDTWDDGNGPMMIAAAGNNNNTDVKYPAGYDCVIAVSAVVPFTKNGTPHDERRISKDWGSWGWGSSYGDHLAVAGYGERYYTTFGSGDNQYWDGVNHPFFNGTSCACPTVAGVMALLISGNPGHDGYWYTDRIEQTADDLHEPGFDIDTGWGRVNALRAVYGSDRFTDLEDENGFVQLELTQEGIELYDSIHDVSQDNPHADPWDLYKFTAQSDGCMEVYLDIFAWGENVDLALFADPWLTQMIADSTVENHADSSFETIDTDVLEGEAYYLSVYSPEFGNSTTYGLMVDYISNDLVLLDENIAPVSAPAGEIDVPFLKLSVAASCSGTLDELIINKHSSDSEARFGVLKLYFDTDGSGDPGPGDELIASEDLPAFTRVRFTDLSLGFTNENPLVLFVAGDIESEVESGSELYVSLETYRDLTVEKARVDYSIFPVNSGSVQVE
jgi:subtilisin family serine protease